MQNNYKTVLGKNLRLHLSSDGTENGDMLELMGHKGLSIDTGLETNTNHYKQGAISTTIDNGMVVTTSFDLLKPYDAAQMLVLQVAESENPYCYCQMLPRDDMPFGYAGVFHLEVKEIEAGTHSDPTTVKLTLRYNGKGRPQQINAQGNPITDLTSLVSDGAA